MENSVIQQVINDLVRINNDRVEGYRTAIKELEAKEQGLSEVFLSFIGVSEKNNRELKNIITIMMGDAATDTTIEGKVYRVWMDLKKEFSNNTKLAVLESCEYGEDAAQKAYNEAIELYPDLPADIRELLYEQRATLRMDHDTVKTMRDREREKVS